ncbi:ATP-binding protein [Stenotrophomonas sp. HITSZ_GD]|uniref:hybrid sensor histidine kinase/response regulator n=1 Tax=Stenotrophomonas sp. HITSZ_GD TaxID=3037248 RepID=UPI00240DBEB4|nr:hybrid sensor histidine kinase/response regulator [Stenotrophomonas sp. HITSZ_GD]MDG2525460.1 ATP-binding protein [Stenotrophomonas sp. HITSZ_GD]
MACMWLGVAFAAPAAVPEQPRFGLVEGGDGLPSTEISGIAQDREGYLWLATGDGLARYDGAGFKVWRHDPGDPASLPGNSVQGLYIDAEDRIWVTAEGRGVSVLDRARQRFRHYRADTHPQLRDEDVFTLAGRAGEVWFGTQGGQLYRIAAAGALSRVETAGLLPPGTHIMAMAATPHGELWIGTTGGLLRYDGRRLHREAMPLEDGVFALAWIDGRLWVSSAAGILWREGTGAWRLPAWSRRFGTEAGNIVWAVAAAGDGEYWLGSERGLWRTHGEQPPVQMLGEQVPLSRRRNVMALLRGQDGGLWVPLHGRGLAYLRADWKRTAVLPLPVDLGDGVYCPLVQAREGGLWQVEPRGQLSRLPTHGGARQTLPAHWPALRDMPVTAGVEDRRGRLWLGNYLTGLSRIDLRTAAYWTWHDPADATPQYGAPGWMVEDARGDIWLSVLNTLQRRDGDSGRVLDAFVFGRDALLPGTQIGQLGNGPAGEVWVSGNRGVHAWDAARRRFVPVPGMLPQEVSAFALAPDGQVWTYRLGELTQWRRQGAHWRVARRMAAAQGVPATEPMDMRVDALGRVWLATRRGLWRMDPSATGPAASRAFGLRDGLSSREFIRGCLRLDRDGVLAGATVDGHLLLIDTRMPDPPPATPPLRIEEISVMRDGQRIGLPVQGTLTLRATDRQLRVAARLLSFGDGQGIRYRWRLHGLEEAWSDFNGQSLREFPVLPPGQYTLQIQGVDAQGNASNVHHLRLSMPPPWWRSHLGLLLFALLILLAVWAVAALYRQRLRARHAWQLAQHKREVAEQASLAKSHFLATLGHEVRTPMTGVLGMTELLLQTPLDARQHGYASAIDTAGRHLLRLVNDALDLARIEAGKLSLERRNFPLHALLEQAMALARPLAARKGLAFVCEIDPALPVALRGDPSRVRQILLNLLSNAIKFTERGTVALHAMPGAPGGGVVFEIHDTGPGLSAEQQAGLFRRFEQGGAHGRARHGGSGLGLAICRELATAMGGHVGVDSTPGQGACFRVTLPLPWAEQADIDLEAGAAAPPDTPLPPLRLLLVEDDDTVADVVRGLLHARGHRVTRVAHALAALAELQVQAFDVGLFDLDLPGIDGLGLVRQLRTLGRTLPVIALTARSDPDAEPQTRAAGCAGFLRKPVTGDGLARALAALDLPASAAAPA